MSQAKSATLFGLGVELESAYGDGGTIVNADDAYRMTEETIMTIDYANDGGREMDGATGRPLKRGEASAPSVEFAPPTRVKGAGAAYSATVAPNGSDVIRSCGWDAAIVTTGGSETYTFSLTDQDGSPASLFGNAFARGQLYPFVGAVGSLNWIIDAAGYMMMTPNLMGILSAEPTDIALPSDLDYGTVMPPKAVGLAIAIGDFATPLVRRIEFAQNRVTDPRLDGNADAGHGGFSCGPSVPTITIDLEATAFVASPFHTTAGLQPWELYQRGTEEPISFTLGSVQYNRTTFTASECQLIEVPEEPAEGPTGMWRLVFQINDAMSWLFD